MTPVLDNYQGHGTGKAIRILRDRSKFHACSHSILRRNQNRRNMQD